MHAVCFCKGACSCFMLVMLNSSWKFTVVSSIYSWGDLKGMGNTWLISVRVLSNWVGVTLFVKVLMQLCMPTQPTPVRIYFQYIACTKWSTLSLVECGSKTIGWQDYWVALFPGSSPVFGIQYVTKYWVCSMDTLVIRIWLKDLQLFWVYTAAWVVSRLGNTYFVSVRTLISLSSS